MRYNIIDAITSDTAKIAGGALLTLYLLVKPCADYMVGEDTFWSRALFKPESEYYDPSAYADNPEAEWKSRLEGRREAVDEWGRAGKAAAKVIRFLP